MNIFFNKTKIIYKLRVLKCESTSSRWENKYWNRKRNVWFFIDLRIR